jgi:hypothetical protein
MLKTIVSCISHRIHLCIYGNIYHQYTPNVSIYTIHGSCGYSFSLNPLIVAFPLDAVREWLQKSKSLTTRRKSRVSLTGDLRLCRRIFSAAAGDVSVILERICSGKQIGISLWFHHGFMGNLPLEGWTILKKWEFDCLDMFIYQQTWG